MFELPLWVTAHVEGLAYGYAIWKGGAEERLIGWTEAGILAVAIALLGAHPHLWVEVVSVTVELGVVLSLALRSNKIWPLVYASTVLVSALTIFAQTLHPVGLWAYVTTKFVWYYLECVILVVGTWRASVDRKRRRPDLQMAYPATEHN
jgi:hypothetical protein